MLSQPQSNWFAMCSLLSFLGQPDQTLELFRLSSLWLCTESQPTQKSEWWNQNTTSPSRVKGSVVSQNINFAPQWKVWASSGVSLWWQKNAPVFIPPCVYLRAWRSEDTAHSKHVCPANSTWRDPIKLSAIPVNQTCHQTLVKINSLKSAGP